MHEPIPALSALRPQVETAAQAASCVGVGIDCVDIPAFAYQLTIPGTVLAERAFTSRERRECQQRSQVDGSDTAEHYAARWAAKEAFVKALSAAIRELKGAQEPLPIRPEDLAWDEMEVLTDTQRRPHLHLHGTVAQVCAEVSAQAEMDLRWQVSLSHDGRAAVAVVLACV